MVKSKHMYKWITFPVDILQEVTKKGMIPPKKTVFFHEEYPPGQGQHDCGLQACFHLPKVRDLAVDPDSAWVCEKSRPVHTG